jgi:PAS domain S-box-containing protein
MRERIIRSTAVMHFSISSLRVRLMMLVGLALLPVVGLALYTAAGQRRLATHRIHQETLRLARLCAENEERLFDGAHQLLVTLSQVPSVWQLDAASCNALFAKVREQYPIYANLGLLDARGNIVSSALPSGAADNFAHRSYFQRAMESGGFAIGDYQIGQITGKATINVALPLLDPTGRPYAVLFAALELTWLSQMAALADMPPGSSLSLVDQSGTVVARVPDPENWVGKPSGVLNAGRAILQTDKRDGTVTARGADGVEKIYAFAHVGGASAQRPYIVAGIPTATAFREARETLIRQLTALGFIMALALVGAWIASDALILRRAQSIVAATRRLEAGDLSARTGLGSGASELNELARAFDEMAAALEARIAERDRIDAALRKSEAMFRSLFEASPDAVIVQTLEGEVLDVNPMACQLYSASRESLIGRNTSELIPAEELPRLRDTLTHWKEGDMISFEATAAGNGGRLVPVSMLASRIDFKGRDAILVHLRDITERRRVENERKRAQADLERRVEERTRQLAEANAALRETTERFELVMRGTNDGIWDWDLRSNSVYFSPRWKTMLGYDSSEIADDFNEWQKRIHPDDRARAERTIRDYIEGKTAAYSLQHRLLAKDGSWRWILSRGIALRDAEGRPYRIAGSHFDLTERIEAQERLEKLAEDLRRSNEELEQFAYIASHDLQEPLRMVASYTQLLERRYKDKLDAAAQEFIGFAVDGARRMQQFINDLLDYSRVGTRGRPFKPVHLDEALNQALANLQVAITDRKAVITRDPLPVANGDLGQLVRVFQNLIGNALKFCRNHPPAIHLGATRLGDAWEISVRDNGIGIAPEHFERIFVIFQRLHTRQEFGGTGIGLAVCKKIVERHGGSIRVESEVGHGTTFYFTIPAAGGPPAG